MLGKQEKPRRKPDERVRRTHERLGNALVQLIGEKPIDDITVQEVLDRASVGRSTFYLHFRDKNDLLLSQLEMFLERMSTALTRRNDKSDRVVPVEEMFAHIGGQNKMYRALGDSGRLNDFFDLAHGYFARGIEQRLERAYGNPSVFRNFGNVNWLFVPLPWPGACWRCCDGGLIGARKNLPVRWTNCFTG